MKFLVLGFFILCGTPAFQIMGQENGPTTQKEALYLSAGTGRANINFVADSIERQDPSKPSSSAYASVVHLKGNVVIRTCCVQRGLSKKNQPKQLMIMRADEADYHGENGDIEVRGNVRVNFQNYPK